MTTFLAPPSRCLAAPSRLVKTPVDSTTISTPTSPQGIWAGSRSEKVFTSWSPMRRMLPSSSTSSGQIPCTESRWNKSANPSIGARSFAATISTSPFWIAAFATIIPILPNPFIPTRTATASSVRRLLLLSLLLPNHPTFNRFLGSKIPLRDPPSLPTCSSQAACSAPSHPAATPGLFSGGGGGDGGEERNPLKQPLQRK